MAGELDDLDEPDYRRAVIDEDVVSELTQLRGAVETMKDELQQEADQTREAINELSWSLGPTLGRIQTALELGLVLIIIGLCVIVGTLRHWF